MSKKVGIGANRRMVEELGKRIFEAADELGCNPADVAETCAKIISFLEQHQMVIGIACPDEMHDN